MSLWHSFAPENTRVLDGRGKEFAVVLVPVVGHFHVGLMDFGRVSEASGVLHNDLNGLPLHHILRSGE